MDLLPNQIIDSLDKKDQALLNEILTIEKRKLHILQIKSNSKDEKNIVSDIVRAIDKAVKNDN